VKNNNNANIEKTEIIKEMKNNYFYYLFFSNFVFIRKNILDYSWEHHYVTSTLEYTVYVQKPIFIYIVPTP
jgi:hypothetical protein